MIHPNFLIRHRLSARGLHEKKGSVLIVSFFVAIILVALAIPQTSRSIGSVALEERALASHQLWHMGEAGIDEALRSVFRDPDLSKLGDGLHGNCIPPPGWEAYDCQQETLPTNWAQFTILADDDNASGYPKATGGEGVMRKRVRVITKPLSGVLLSSEESVREMLVEVKWPLSRGIRATGNVEIGINSDIDADIVVDSLNSSAIYIKKGAAVSGQLSVWDNGLGADKLCCDNDDTIHISTNGNARLQAGDTYGLVADNINGNGTDGDIYINPGEPYYPQRVDGTTVTPIVAKPDPIAAGLCTTVYPEQDVSGTVTFCPTGMTGNGCTHFVGEPADADGTVRYCFNSLKIAGGSTVRFQGKKVEVYLIGKIPTTQWAMKATNTWSKIYARVDPLSGETDLAKNASPLTFIVPESNTYCATDNCGIRIPELTEVWGSIDAPNSYVWLGYGYTNNNVMPNSMWLYGDEIVAKRLRMKFDGAPQSGAGALISQSQNYSVVTDVNLLGWRTCPSDNPCTP